ncbi:hypothetical protein C0J52_14214 [Blattella germanica]|nr:hypothetical protein C0J52_14214 [Blattella germanica]
MTDGIAIVLRSMSQKAHKYSNKSKALNCARLWCPYRLPDRNMGEIAGTVQSDSEGSNSSLELGSGGSSGGSVKCRWQGCGHWFGHLDLLASHVTRVHASSGQGGLFYCGWEGCTRGDRGFNARFSITIHILLVAGERPYVCPVPGCGKAYSNSSDRFKHTRTHSVDKPYVCKVPGCPKRYTDPSSLRKHVKTYRHFPPMEEESIKPVNNGVVSDEDDSLTEKQVVCAPVKMECSEPAEMAYEEKETKVSESSPSPVPCSKPCCTGAERNAVVQNPDVPLLWGHDVHYNLFRSWMNADLAVLSHSLPWTSSFGFWNHPYLQPSSCGQQISGVINRNCVPSSGMDVDSIKYSHLDVPTGDVDSQDLPLDLTIHRAGTRV